MTLLFAEGGVGSPSASDIGTWVLISLMALTAITHIKSLFGSKTEGEKPATKDELEPVRIKAERAVTKEELEAVKTSLMAYATKVELQRLELQLQGLLTDWKDTNRRLDGRIDTMIQATHDLRLLLEKQHSEVREDTNRTTTANAAKMEEQNVRLTTAEIKIAALTERRSRESIQQRRNSSEQTTLSS